VKNPIRKTWLLWILLLVTVAFGQPASPELGLPMVRNYTNRDYGFTSSFYSAVQDTNGVLLFGSPNLIFEYDGVSWRNTRPGNASNLRTIVRDPSGRIWVGVQGGFGYLEADADGQRKYTSLVDKIPEADRAFNVIYEIQPTKNGVYFQSNERIFRWDGKRMHIWAAKSQFYSLAEVNGRLYTSQTGIGLQEIVGDELKDLPGGDAYKKFRRLFFHAHDNGRILVTASGESLSLYDGEKMIPFPAEADEYLKKSRIYGSNALPDGSFCINTNRGGAVILERDGRVRRILNRDAGLQSQSVFNAFTDRDGALWLSLSTGVTRVDLNSPVSIFSLSPTSSVARLKGTIYSSAPGGVVSRLVPNPKTGLHSFEPIPTPSIQLAGPMLHFRDVAGAPEQLLLASDVGVMLVEGNGVKPAVAGLEGPREAVRFLLRSRKYPGRVYVSHANGLSSIRWDGTKWLDEGRLPNFLTSVGRICEADDGAVWGGTQLGALRVEATANGLKDAPKRVFSQQDGLESGLIDTLYVAGQIYTSSASQYILRWDGSTGKFIPDKRFFLPLENSQYDGTFQQPNGDVWAYTRGSTDARYAMFRRKADGAFELDETPFRRLTRSFSAQEPYMEPNGVLWFPTREGLIRFDQRVRTVEGQSFATLVRRVEEGSGKLIFGGNSAAAASKPVQLAAGHNTLLFSFAAPTFEDETGTSYQYRLEGADSDWSRWGKVTQANYTSLAPGDYRFRVRGRSIGGKIGEEGSYAFTIPPPWYRSTFAYIGCGLLFALAAYGARQRVISREREKARRETEALEAQAKTLETTVAERTKEISDRAAELATVNRITQALSSQLDKDGLVQLVGDQIREVFRAQIAYVSLFDRATNMLHFPYTYGEEVPSRPMGEGLTSQVIMTGKPVLINQDVRGTTMRLGIRSIGRDSASFLGVPILSGGEAVGVLSVQTTDLEGRFTEADQRLLSTIASSVGVAFHNAQLFEEARQAKAVAEQADEAKSTFLSTVSHELRTPLTSVLGFAKIIRKRLDETLFPLVPEDDKKIQRAKKQVSDNLNVVVSEGERLTKLINDVLDLAKIQAGKITWNMGPVAVTDVIERSLAATSALFETKKLELVRDLSADLPGVYGDSDRLIQVVINLISNAVKFTEAGTVTCSAAVQGNEIVVSVKDSGVGIRPEDQPKVFEKFKQVGDTLTDKPQGTGLGLPISKEIVEYHGGRIWVESEIGRGSTFFFTLPVSKSAPARTIDIGTLVRQLKQNVAGQQPRPKSVLVVDDDANIRSVLQQEFTEAGYPVRLAENGRQALDMIREEQPGIVILDVMMPEMNGFEVAAVLKNDPATMDIPIIILSIVEDKERGFRLGVDRYLTKPIDTVSLFCEVGALLEQGKSKKKVLVVDEDQSTIRTLADALETRGYHVMESNGEELVSKAMAAQPDIIVLSSVLSSSDGVRALRFEKGMEDVLFLIYQ
jgi:signal transduction histidine kinase/CheY-like chemotaxis protein/ligand-binding sensor domain-containing protein